MSNIVATLLIRLLSGLAVLYGLLIVLGIPLRVLRILMGRRGGRAAPRLSDAAADELIERRHRENRGQ